jgi:hypothetical protein
MQAKITHESTKLVPNLPKQNGVMAFAGAYQNAKSIKHVTVTGPY